jgi:transposase
MKKSNKFSPEVRDRAVPMVQEHRGEYPPLWAAIDSIAPKIGCVPHKLNEWVKRVEVDSGGRDGVSTAETLPCEGTGAREQETAPVQWNPETAQCFLSKRSSTIDLKS